jgi:iron-sulfur cluster assembly protein
MITAAPPSEAVAPAISVTENALKHLNRIKNDRDEDLCLRIGVKQGGCSGMSYTMDFENRANARPDDSIIEYNGFAIGLRFFLQPLFFFFPCSCKCWRV